MGHSLVICCGPYSQALGPTKPDAGFLAGRWSITSKGSPRSNTESPTYGGCFKAALPRLRPDAVASAGKKRKLSKAPRAHIVAALEK